MKEFETITQYQLLYLARQELSRRINSLKDDIIRGNTSQSPRRSEALLKMYTNQIGEIINRMAEINNEHDQ